MLSFLWPALTILLICSLHSVSASEMTTDAKNKLEVPDGWSLKKKLGSIQIISPEQDVTIYLLQLPAATQYKYLIQTAWKRINPAFNLKVLQDVNLLPTDGWDRVYEVYYDTPAKAFYHAFAYMRIFQNQAYLSLVEGSSEGLNRRDAEVETIILSWKPNNLVEPDLSQNPVRAWTIKNKREFERFVQAAMQSLSVPGASIAIVHKGEIVYSNAFGLKKMSSANTIKLDTVFMIGSITKPLTTLMMAKLVDEKRLSWHTPIVKLLQNFQLADPHITKKLKLWHTVCACTGMPRRDFDFIFNFNGVEPEQRLLEMKKMKPTTDFGKTFQYSNYLVAAGGYAAAHAYDEHDHLGEAYNKAMKELVFIPLGMNHTVLKTDEALTIGAAMPHAPDIYNKMHEIPLRNESESVYSLSPAGGTWSTANDIAKYMLLELCKGKLANGKTMISEAEILRRRDPSVKVNDKSYYGLGLLIKKEEGLQVIGHDGAIFGYSSSFFMVPDKQFGMVVLTNTNGRNGFPFIAAVEQKVKELTLGAKSVSKKMIELAVKTNKETAKKTLKRISLESKDLSLLAPLIGKYTNPDLGYIKLASTQNGFTINFNGTIYQVGLRNDNNGDKLLVIISPPWSGNLEFLIQDNGNHLILDGGQIRYIFIRDNS